MGKYKIDKPVALIQLFGGIGTQALAFETLGVPFTHHRLVEIDKDAVASYNKIHGTSFVPVDIRTVHIEDLGIEDKEHNHFFLTYTFPCTSISTAGKMGGMRREDWEAGNPTESGLLWEVYRILKEGYEKGVLEQESGQESSPTKYLPDTLLMENVTGVHSGKNKDDWEFWLSFLSSLGYKTVWKDMNALDYGVPQNRNRCFAVSFLDKAEDKSANDFSFPEPIPLVSSMEDYLEDDEAVGGSLFLPPVGSENPGGSKWVYDKYRKFYDKHGYLPRFFKPYNVRELPGICSTITTSTCHTTGIGTVIVATGVSKAFPRKKKSLTVLSLFDGISCGRLALERAGIPVEAYYASEIEKSAMKVAMENFPDTIQIGDVRKVHVSDLPKIDLLIGGSPCTNLSFAGNMVGCETTTGDKGHRPEKVTTLERYLYLKENGFSFNGFSYLFWEYVRILRDIREYNPKVLFLLENVVMAKEWERVFTDTLGVSPIRLNSCLVSAQNRERLYWTNIPYLGEPEDKHIRLQDILEDVSPCHHGAIRGRYTSELQCNSREFFKEKLSGLRKASITGRRIGEDGHRKDYDMSVKITQCLEVRSESVQKSNCLTTVEKDNVLTPMPPGRHPDAFGIVSGERLPFRYYTRREYERLQTLPDGYTDCISEAAAKKAIGNGWTVDIVAHLLKGVLGFVEK